MLSYISVHGLLKLNSTKFYYSILLHTRAFMKSLTREETRKKQELIDAYSDFWNNIKFRKGWQKPLFQRDEVLHLLDRAAEIVIRKRSLLDKDGEFKMRMVDGAAREYLWSVTEHPIVPADKAKEDKFVHDLVHATFKDANGYVEGLTEGEIDDFIIQVEHEFNESLPITTRIPQTINRLKAVSQLLLNEEITSKVLEDKNCKNYLEKLDRLLRDAENEALQFSKLYHAFEKEIEHHSSEGESEPSEEEIMEQACTSLRESGANIPVIKDSPIIEYNDNDDIEDNENAEEDDEDDGVVIEDVTDEIESNDNVSNKPDTEMETSDDPVDSISDALDKVNINSDNTEDIEDIETVEQQSPEEQEKEDTEELERQKELKRKEEEREQQKKEAEQRRRLLERAEKKKQMEEQENSEKERINKWKRLKCEPRIDVSERADGFLITGYLSKMSKDDLEVKVDESNLTLTINGFIYPSKEEELKLKNQLLQTIAYRYGRRYASTMDDNQLEELLLRSGAGEYGSFSESYSIPSYVDFDNIQSSYEGGVLRIAVPVTKRHRTPRQTYRSPAYESDYFAPSFFSHPYSRGGFW